MESRRGGRQRRIAVMPAIAAMACGAWAPRVRAFDINTGTDLELRWDNTLKYTAAVRVQGSGTAYAQAPLDAIKALSVPGTQTKDLFMPLAPIASFKQNCTHDSTDTLT